MLGIHDLEERLGLSEWQTRRLVDAVRPILSRQGLIHGSQGAKLEVSPQAIALLERAKDHNDSGIPLKSLANVIDEELHGDAKAADQTVEERPSVAQESATAMQRLLEEKDARLQELHVQLEAYQQREEWLRDMLENREDQLRALMPGKDEETPERGPVTPHSTSLSRWQHLKAALLGRM